MEKKEIRSSNAPSPIGPYSQAILSGNTLYVSGQIAIDPSSGELLQGSLEEETHLVMKNLKAVLKEAGMDLSHVLKCSIFLKSMGDFAEVNKIYGSYFSEPYPARETVEVSQLPKDVRVEISCVAVKA
jgi:2-iminobutanoate/2-iminopropanoate deaminase